MNEIWNAYLDELDAHIRTVAQAMTLDPSSVNEIASLDLEAPPEGTMPATLAIRAKSLVDRMDDLGHCIEDEMSSVIRRRRNNRARTAPVYIDSKM